MNRNKEEIKSGEFSNDVKLKDKPGEEDRLSMRVGLKVFNEGITLSYAYSLDQNKKNYSPFKVFACLSDKTESKPFILYYDPIINKNNFSRGPIVVHGGFTSAFYDFKEEGTGRLVISIACWLVRPEENIKIISEKKGNKIQAIKPLYSNTEFNKWIQNISGKTMFSIMILDVSGSMRGDYKDLIDMANEIIEKQMENPKNEGRIIFFASYVKSIIGKGDRYRLLKMEDITKANVGGGTMFKLGFDEAEKYLDDGKNFDLKRVLFLTDGEDYNSNLISNTCQKMKDLGYIVNMIGFRNSSEFQKLKEFASEGCFHTKDTFKEIKEICIQAFAA